MKSKTDLVAGFRIMRQENNKLKCILCRKERGSHKAKTLNCPSGLKHRVLGYTGFHSTNVFTPKK